MNALNLKESTATFAANLYESVRTSTPDTTNVVLAPLSVHIAIGLAAMAASGETANECRKCLQLGDADTAVAITDAFDTLIGELSKVPRLAVVHKMYVQNSYRIKESYRNIASKKFQSEIDMLDFAQSDRSANIINHWVANQTDNLIQKIIPTTNALGAHSRLVLVTATSFKGCWVHPFDVRNTEPKPFFETETSSVDVDMMHMSANVPFATLEKLFATAVQLKYKDSHLSMIIVLPNKRTGLGALDDQLKQTNLEAILDSMYISGEVKLSLPRFKVEFAVALKKPLTKMGMPTMFADGLTDFSSILENSNPLNVSDVLHKAFIRVTEEGTEVVEGEAEEVVKARHSSIPIKLMRFKADHPFHYFIVDGCNVVLLSGSYRQARE